MTKHFKKTVYNRAQKTAENKVTTKHTYNIQGERTNVRTPPPHRRKLEVDFISSYLTANLAHGGFRDVARDLIGDDGVRRTARVRPLATRTPYHLLVDFRLRGFHFPIQERVTLCRRRRPCGVKEPAVRLLSSGLTERGDENREEKKAEKWGSRAGARVAWRLT